VLHRRFAVQGVLWGGKLGTGVFLLSVERTERQAPDSQQSFDTIRLLRVESTGVLPALKGTLTDAQDAREDLLCEREMLCEPLETLERDSFADLPAREGGIRSISVMQVVLERLLKRVLRGGLFRRSHRSDVYRSWN
jgi:hypothetical protein